MSAQAERRANSGKSPRVLVTYLSERGLDTLLHRELMVTPPDKFNDPYEFRLAAPVKYDDSALEQLYLSQTGIPWLTQRGKYSSEAEYRRWVKQVIGLPRAKHRWLFGELREEMIHSISQHTGVACFSDLTYDDKPPDHNKAQATMLMWGHYADKHKGLLIEFDPSCSMLQCWFSQGRLFPVKYSKTRPSCSLRDFDFGVGDSNINNILIKWAAAKSKAWAYESEWRLVSPLEPSNFMATRLVGGRLLHFAALRPTIGKPASPWLEPEPIKAIRRVVIGCKATPAFESDVRKILTSRAYEHVVVQKARLDEKNFDVNYVTLRNGRKHSSRP